MGYNSFIKGGLPLNSYDFVDRENALANKSKLLVALDKINKLHNKQMQTYDTSVADNNLAMDKTIDAVASDMNRNNGSDLNLNSITTQAFDSSPSSLWQAPSITDMPAPAEQAPAEPQGQALGNIFDLARDNPQSDMYQAPMYTNDDAQAPMYVNEEEVVDPFAFQNQEGEYEAMSLPGDAGEPMYVIDESQVGKRGKEKGRVSVSSNDIKSARLVAWMAYIIFFLPLLFMGRNTFVKHHANNALCYNIIDAIGVGLIFIDRFVTPPDNKWISLAIMIATIFGFMLIALTTLIKLVSILISWAGREVRNPVLNKFNVIK